MPGSRPELTKGGHAGSAAQGDGESLLPASTLPATTPSSDPLSTLSGSRQAVAIAEEGRFLRRVDWNLFRQFYDIVHSGSLSGAARRLNQQQPSLSAALKRLEDHLGVTLCRRTPRGIELTAAGKAMMQLCSDMVEAVRVAPHLTSQAAKHIEGRLSIYLLSNVVCSEFNEALSSFHRRHRAVEIHLTVAPWRAVLEALATNMCDVGIACDSGPRRQFQYEPLFRETQQLYCGPSHHLYGQRLREPSVAAHESFILTQGDEPEDLERFRKRFGLGQDAVGSAEDLHEASRLISLGLGIGFLPTIVAHSSRDLWPLLPASILPTYFVYLISPGPSHISTPAQLFIDEMRRRLRAADNFADRRA